MNINQLEKQLIAAARRLPPNDQVPYAFEKRVMAALSAAEALDPWALWSHLLWRAAAPCVAIMLVISIWSVASNSSNSNLATALERAVWAPLASLNETW